jgi:glycine/D-amino acid oxidase-like deaminating enzyme
MRLAFMDRMDAFADYLHAYPDQNHFNQDFQYEFGCGAIRPAYTIHLSAVLRMWRARLVSQGWLLPGQVKAEEIIIKEGRVKYRDITARRVIFCEGIDAANNPWFSLLPFSPNKGEALVIECPGLNREHIFKKSMLLVPLPGENRFWAGASYEWDFEDAGPTAGFLKKTTTLLDNWLKLPYTVVDHLAAVRPATLERRPFVGIHPQASEVAIFNGMGSKGSSLAPYFAHQLVQHLEYGSPLTPEVDVNRFSRILGRQ